MGRQKRDASIEIGCNPEGDDCGDFFGCYKNDNWDGIDSNFEFTCQLVAWPIVLIVIAVVGVVVARGMQRQLKQCMRRCEWIS